MSDYDNVVSADSDSDQIMFNYEYDETATESGPVMSEGGEIKSSKTLDQTVKLNCKKLDNEGEGTSVILTMHFYTDRTCRITATTAVEPPGEIESGKIIDEKDFVDPDAMDKYLGSKYMPTEGIPVVTQGEPAATNDYRTQRHLLANTNYDIPEFKNLEISYQVFPR